MNAEEDEKQRYDDRRTQIRERLLTLIKTLLTDHTLLHISFYFGGKDILEELKVENNQCNRQFDFTMRSRRSDS